MLEFRRDRSHQPPPDAFDMTGGFSVTQDRHLLFDLGRRLTPEFDIIRGAVLVIAKADLSLCKDGKRRRRIDRSDD